MTAKKAKHKKTKTDQLIARLSRARGAGMDELTRTLGWQPHTVRAALSGLRKRGYVLVRTKDDAGQSRHRITREP